MKKLFLLILLMCSLHTMAHSQFFRKKINVENAKFVAPVGNFNLIFIDIDGQMDIHDTMEEINGEHNPTIILIKDEKMWRMAQTLEEASRMPDDVAVVAVKYKKTIPYKRTGYD